MDRYEQRANERDELIRGGYRKSGEPPTYWDREEIKEWMQITDILRASSTTYTPPSEDERNEST